MIKGTFIIILSIFGSLLITIKDAQAQDFPVGTENLDYMKKLPVLRDHVVARELSTHDKAGGNDNGFTNKAEWIRKEKEGVVIFDVEGPGSIMSFWYSWPNYRSLPKWVDRMWACWLGDVEIYIDQKDEPYIDVPLRQFIGPCPHCYPLAVTGDESTGGYISYVPISFQDGAKVIVDHAAIPNFFYHFWYHTYPFGTEVESYTGEGDFSRWLEEWNPENIGPITKDRLWETDDVTVEARSEKEFARFDTAGIIRSIRMLLPEDDEALRSLRLLVYWEGEDSPSVEAPLSLLYAVENRFSKKPAEVADNAKFRSIVIGKDEEGLWYFNLPMPFNREARLALANCREDPVRVGRIKVEIENKPFPGLGKSAGYFRTHFNQSRDLVANRDYVLAHLHGRGHIVGTVLAVEDTPETFLEGDERIYVDGSRYPLIMGDATETYFNGSWYFSESAFSCPLHGAPTFRMIDRSIEARSDVTMYRFHLTDLVPFRSEVRFSIQHGPVNNVPGNYRSLVFYYGLEQPVLFKSDLVAMADEESLGDHQFKGAGKAKIFKRDGFFEGEFDGDILGELERPKWLSASNWMFYLTLKSIFGKPPEDSPDRRTFKVRQDKDAYEFSMQIDPDNNGVILRRLFDQGIPDQRARIEVDGEDAGVWFNAGHNKWKIWCEDEFMIGPELTSGKDNIRIQVSPLSGVFTACEYEALSLVL
jgi:hypothetical protein